MTTQKPVHECLRQPYSLIDKNWKQLRCPSRDKWVNYGAFIQQTTIQSHKERAPKWHGVILMYIAKWRKRVWESSYYMTMWHFGKGKATDTEKPYRQYTQINSIQRSIWKTGGSQEWTHTVTTESECITTCEHKNNPTTVGGRESGDPRMSGKEWSL